MYSYNSDVERIVRNILNIEVRYVTHSSRPHLVCFCPFHDNVETPSFSVDLKTGAYHCFNPNCNVSGKNIASLIKNIYGFGDDRINQILESNVSYVDNVSYNKVVEDLSKIFKKNVTDLKYSSSVHNYLKKNRLLCEKTIKTFNIGYHEYSNCIAIPIRLHNGELVGYKFRLLHETKNKNKYFSTRGLKKHTLLFGLHIAKHTYFDFVILVEGEFDALSLYDIGFDNVVAATTSGLNKEQIELLSNYFDNILIMFDNDKAGLSGTKSIIKKVTSLFRKVKIYEYRDSVKDPDELVKLHKRFGTVVKLKRDILDIIKV